MSCESIKTPCHLAGNKLETTFIDHLRNLNVQEEEKSNKIK